jgi:hypothetical protein
VRAAPLIAAQSTHFCGLAPPHSVRRARMTA